MLSTEREVIFYLREHNVIGNNSSNNGLLQDGATATLRKMQAMKSKKNATTQNSAITANHVTFESNGCL